MNAELKKLDRHIKAEAWKKTKEKLGIGVSKGKRSHSVKIWCPQCSAQDSPSLIEGKEGEYRGFALMSLRKWDFRCPKCGYGWELRLKCVISVIIVINGIM